MYKIKLQLLLTTILIATFLSSCVISYYPMAENENEFYFDPNLYGLWKDTSAKVDIFIDTVGLSQEKIYSIALIHHDNGNQPAQDTSYFNAFIVNSGGKKYVNLNIDKDHEQLKRVGKATVDLIPETYVILKLEEKKDQLILSKIDEEVLTKLINSKKILIKHVSKNEDDYLLTEKPKQLKVKMNELNNHKGAFKVLYTLSKSGVEQTKR